MIKILETKKDNVYLIKSSQKLREGKNYELIEKGTLEQNKMFHELVNIYYSSGVFSYDVSSFGEFRNHIKKDFGAGFEYYLYVDDKGKIRKTKELGEIGNKDKYGVLKSWSKYTKRERTTTIDRLINEMYTVFYHNNFHSPKFEEIIGDLKK